MKKTIRVTNARGKYVDKQINYIPVRYIIAAMLTLFSILAIIGVVVALCYFVPYFYLAAWATAIACLVKLISSDDNPDYKVPWIVFVMVIPIAGFMLYFIFYSRQMGKLYVRRLNDISKGYYKKDDSADFERLKEENELVYTHAKMLCSTADSHLFSDTKLKYLSPISYASGMRSREVFNLNSKS